MESFDFVAHASHQIRGGRLLINVHAVQIPPVVPTENLVAAHNAVVTEIVVMSGTPRVSVGDAVVAGQVLVEAAFQIGTTVGEMDEYGFFTYAPVMKGTTAVAIVRGRVSDSRSAVVATSDEADATAAQLEEELRGANPHVVFDDMNVFVRTFDGQFVVEVVGSWTVDLVHRG